MLQPQGFHARPRRQIPQGTVTRLEPLAPRRAESGLPADAGPPGGGHVRHGAARHAPEIGVHGAWGGAGGEREASTGA